MQKEEMNCPACSHDGIREEILSVTKDYSISGFAYKVCSDCGSTYLSDDKVTNQADLTRLHEEYWHKSSNFKFAPERTIRQHIELSALQARSITEVCDLNGKSRVLDVGCGNGELVAALVEVNCDAYGFEPNTNAFEALNFDPSLDKRLFNCSIEELFANSKNLAGLHNCLNEKFDLIIMNDVLEHLFAPSDALVFLLNMLNENGALYIQIPSGDSLQIRFLKQYAWNFMAPFHRTLFSKIGVEKLTQNLELNVSLSFIENNRHVWGTTRGIAYKAGFEGEHADLRESYSGFSSYDYLLDDFIDEVSVALNMQPSLCFRLIKL